MSIHSLKPTASKNKLSSGAPVLGVVSSVLNKVWRDRRGDERGGIALAQALGVSEIIGRLLAGRDLTLDTVGDYLNPSLKNLMPDPSCLRDLDAGVERVYHALCRGEKIAIFGDYDVDGATSSALFFRFFKELGEEIFIHIPDRIAEGYGPNIEAFSSLYEKGVRLVITVDCGTTSFDALSYAHKIGLDVVVVDHHVAEPKLPPCHALINPNRLDESPKTKALLGELAAVGLSFVFVAALHRKIRNTEDYVPKSGVLPNLLTLLDLVALGTVCDVMPLRGLNRAFVTQGLKIMARRQNLGLKTLADIAGLDERPAAYHLGFLLGPRINAGGRVGQASAGSRLLCTADPYEAQKLAQELDGFNQERKAIEAQVLEEATEQAEAQVARETEITSLVVGSKDWHPGVIGIVAGRLKERFDCPVFAISVDEQGQGKGSGRSVPGIDIGALIHKAKQSGVLLGGGGHPMAGGISLEETQIDPFRDFLKKAIGDLSAAYEPHISLDGVISIKGATTAFVKSLETLAPYGMGNPGPKFAIAQARILKPQRVGTDHVRCLLLQNDGSETLTGIAFRCADSPLGNLLFEAGSEKKYVHVAGSLKVNIWQGYESVQVVIEDAAFA